MMKKTMSVLIALLLTLVMAASAMAESTPNQGVNSNNGSITIENAVKDQTYTIYQILALESYNEAAKAYAYKATEAWSAFINGEGVKDVYVKVDANGYVTWIGSDNAAEFADLAQAYAVKNSLSNQGQKKAESETVEFTGLNLGYYLVDSTLGTLCSLDTTNPSVVMQEKNVQPTNVKTVEEDSTGSYGSENDADIGQTVNFKSTITAQAGAENYLFHDKMSAGLTYTGVTGVTLNGTTVEASNYEVKTDGLSDGCTFEVVFTQAFCDTLKANDIIVISYTAIVNEDAVIGLNGNPNESRIEYGESGNTTTTPPSKTTTYTWDMQVLKYANGDENKPLKDAQFVLMNKDKTKVATVVDGKLTGWVDVPVGDTTAWPENTVLTTDASGKISIEGLDADTYYLREVKAPDGYNKLADDVEVVITGATKAEGSDQLTYTAVIAKVNNQSGAELPSTGGIGTTVFYVVGGALVLIAVVLLVTRKKMSAAKD